MKETKIDRNSVTRKEAIIAVAFLVLVFVIVSNAAFVKLEIRMYALDRQMEGIKSDLLQLKVEQQRLDRKIDRVLENQK